TMGFDPLPFSLEHALAVMERSELVADTLGEQVFSYLICEKRQEVDKYRQQVTPFELNSMLGTV
ncbi:MAG: glutamine synthetase, partial [Microbacteriaceae bacterium]|nr:glutamine synthetase [Microbacteriaceae bacterium]